MTSYDPQPPTRQQLAQVFKDPRTLRAFEKIFDLIPSDLINLLNSIEETSIDANTARALARQALLRNQLALDYVDFNLNGVRSSKQARVGWNKEKDTLDINHGNGVVQQVGDELYVRIINNTGATIANGQVVGFAGAALPTSATQIVVEGQPFLADGSVPGFYMIGLATETIPNGGVGRVTTLGRVNGFDTTGATYGETWVVGDVLYASPTTAGGMTKIKPTAPNLAVPVAVVLDVGTTGDVGVKPIVEQQFYYGTFSKTSNQVPAVANTAYQVAFDNTEIADGVSLVGGTQITVAHAGLYSFSLSFQLVSGSASVKNVWLWFRKNGVDVPNSSFKVSLDSGTAVKAPSRSLFFSLQVGDYIEIMWASDSTNVTLEAIPATAFAPATPAALATVEQIQQ